MRDSAQMVINGQLVGTPDTDVVAPYDQRVIGKVPAGDERDIDKAIEAADAAFATWRTSPRRDRQELLRAIAQGVRDNEEELCDLLIHEIGKPHSAAAGEVMRLALTFDLAADFLNEPSGELFAADYDPRGDDYVIRTERFPRGPVLGIVPWNWPFNLAAHKIAPALAAGNTLIIKPSRQSALSTMVLGELIHECGCPTGVVNTVNVSGSVAGEAAKDDRVKFVSFTGSMGVGWNLRAEVADKPVSLELGGDAFAVVHKDADLDFAVEQLVSGAFAYAGQICISIQHVLAHEAIYEELRDRLVSHTESQASGDPANKETLVGPVITDDDAERIADWISEAEERGANVLCGGSRTARVIEPTWVENVPEDAKLGCQEVFGPVGTLARFSDLGEAIARVNRSEYGLQSAIFTRSIPDAERFYRDVETGGVIVGDFPTLRFDAMPYGGMKRSGNGREGIRYAYEEMTEPKVMVTKVR